MNTENQNHPLIVQVPLIPERPKFEAKHQSKSGTDDK